MQGAPMELFVQFMVLFTGSRNAAIAGSPEVIRAFLWPLAFPSISLHFIPASTFRPSLFAIGTESLILRSTLKKAEETLRPFPCFFKSHRAYIINLDKVIHVQGNAQGYKIRLQELEELVPVSRNMNTEFSDKLLAWRTSIS